MFLGRKEQLLGKVNVNKCYGMYNCFAYEIYEIDDELWLRFDIDYVDKFVKLDKIILNWLNKPCPCGEKPLEYDIKGLNKDYKEKQFSEKFKREIL